MTAPIVVPDRNLVTRRSIFIGAAASLLCAPAIVRAANLMPVRRLPFPYGPQYAGFVERLYLSRARKSREKPESGPNEYNFQSANQSVNEVLAGQVAYAQAHGFLPPYICIYRND